MRLLSEAPVWLKLWNLAFDCVLLILVLYAILHDGPEYARYAKLCDKVCMTQVKNYEAMIENFNISTEKNLSISALLLNSMPKAS